MLHHKSDSATSHSKEHLKVSTTTITGAKKIYFSMFNVFCWKFFHVYLHTHIHIYLKKKKEPNMQATLYKWVDYFCLFYSFYAIMLFAFCFLLYIPSRFSVISYDSIRIYWSLTCVRVSFVPTTVILATMKFLIKVKLGLKNFIFN